MTALDLVWIASHSYPKQTFRTTLPSGVNVHVYCARLIAHPQFGRGDRRRYRFEWRATVRDGDRVFKYGRVIATGRTSDECKAAVASTTTQESRTPK